MKESIRSRVLRVIVCGTVWVEQFESLAIITPWALNIEVSIKEEDVPNLKLGSELSERKRSSQVWEYLSGFCDRYDITVANTTPSGFLPFPPTCGLSTKAPACLG
jgi:hypothetical protein